MQGHVRRRHRASCAKKTDRQNRCNCDGPWQGRFRDPIDRNKWHEKTFPRKVDAEDWLQSHQGAQLRGDWISPRQGDRPFSEVIAAWRESWPGRLSPTTARRYDSIIDNYLTPKFAEVPVARVTHEVVQRYVNELGGNPKIAPGTVRNVYAVLRTAMTRAVRLGMVKTNPCTAIDLPRARREPMLFLSAEEVRAVAEKIDAQYRTLVYVAAYTGLRAGEIAGLHRQDVDLLRNVIHVRRAVKDINGRLELGPTKTHAQRTVSLPAFLAKLLEQHLLASDGGPESFVFQMKGGGPLRMGLVYNRYFRRAVAGWEDKRGNKHAGALPASKHGLRWHDLRHTCASLSIAAGAHPKHIQERLGHSSITVTLDRYGHLMPGAEEALASALDAAFAAEGAGAGAAVVALTR